RARLAERKGRTVDLRHAHALERRDVALEDRSPAAAEEGEMARALALRLANRLAKKAQVAAVVGADRHGGRVLLERRLDDLIRRLVEADIDGLHAHASQDARDRADGDVVAVTERRGEHETNRSRHLFPSPLAFVRSRAVAAWLEAVGRPV